MWEGVQSFHALSERTILPAPAWVHQFRSYQNPYFGDFMEASSHGRDQSLTPFPAPLQRMSTAESSKLLIISGLPGDQSPSRSPPRVTSLEQKTFLSPRKLQGF